MKERRKGKGRMGKEGQGWLWWPLELVMGCDAPAAAKEVGGPTGAFKERERARGEKSERESSERDRVRD